jgi:hypothetical protein
MTETSGLCVEFGMFLRINKKRHHTMIRSNFEASFLEVFDSRCLSHF